MTARTTGSQPFPERGTLADYRDIGEANDTALIQSQRAERERLLVAVRESAAPRRRGGKGCAPCEPHQLTSPDDRPTTNP
jgi:hypothetical protein